MDKRFQLRTKHVVLTSFTVSLLAMSCPVGAVPAGVGLSEATQQQGVVKGKVTDSYGEPIIGATIKVKNSSNATVTDIDGNFTLNNVSRGTLLITYIGYINKEVEFRSGQTLTIALVEDSKALEEVVVVGYGTQKKANLTGSVAAVNFDDVANIPVANTSTMLQGRLPGVVLQTNGAQAGHDDPEIRVRGVGTLGSGSKNNPMVLIDGIESSISQMSELAAEDIESVSVLKDAASAAIYGVRAANGVILVTTKRGAEQKPTITYSGSIALQQATVLPDFVNSYEWAKMYNECQPGKAYTQEQLQKLKDGSDPDHFANTNWAEEMFRTAVMHQHHLSVSGGSQNTHYMLSAQYMDQDGIMKNTNNRRYNFRSNIDSKLGIVKLGLNLSGSRQDIQEPVTSVTGEGLMRYLTWFTRPTVPVQYSNGNWGCVDGNSNIGASVFKNPIQDLYYGRKTNQHQRFDGQIFAEVDIVKGLKFRSSLAYKYYINENILTYNNKWGEHSVNLLLGHSVQENRWDSHTMSKQGFPTDTGNCWDNGQDFYVVRYAEVLLSLAEAMVQKGSYDEKEVLKLVDQVRQRAGMPRVEDVEGSGLSKDTLLEIIKHERRVELAFEGLRLFDLYRWHELDKAVQRVENERTTYGLAYEKRIYNGERDYVWPIPLGELDSNKALEQNALWK